jgi:hypothetical protein
MTSEMQTRNDITALRLPGIFAASETCVPSVKPTTTSREPENRIQTIHLGGFL